MKKLIVILAFASILGCAKPKTFVPPTAPSGALPNSCKPGMVLKDVVSQLEGYTPVTGMEIVPTEDPSTKYTWFEVCVPTPQSSQVRRENKPLHSFVPDPESTKQE